MNAQEPWEAARDAFWEAERGSIARTGDGWDWATAGNGARGWKAAVEAGIDARVAGIVSAADGGAVVVAFREPLTPDEIDDHHERWAEYVPGNVTLVIADGVDAIAAQSPPALPVDPTADSRVRAFADPAGVVTAAELAAALDSFYGWFTVVGGGARVQGQLLGADVDEFARALHAHLDANRARRETHADKASDLADDFLFERRQVIALREVLGEIFTCLAAGDPSLLDSDQVAEWRERSGMEES